MVCGVYGYIYSFCINVAYVYMFCIYYSMVYMRIYAYIAIRIIINKQDLHTIYNNATINTTNHYRRQFHPRQMMKETFQKT